jgi:hypothetical protein
VVVVALSGGHADAVGRIRMVGVDQLGLSPAELGELPSVLAGNADQIAEQLHAHRERFGITYYSIRAVEAEAFGKVLRVLRR